MKNLADRERTFAKNKEHLEAIQSGDTAPDEVEKEKKSIYADFLSKVENTPNYDLIPEMEKEIKRVISTFPLDEATKRIMELVWVTRYEW